MLAQYPVEGVQYPYTEGYSTVMNIAKKPKGTHKERQIAAPPKMVWTPDKTPLGAWYTCTSLVV